VDKAEYKKPEMKGHEGIGFAYRLARVVFYFSIITFYISLVGVAAQIEDPLDLAPPPLKLIPKEEKAKLDAEQDPKANTKLVIELMNSRLDVAEKLNAGEDFDKLFLELGRFRALLDYSLAFLKRRDPNDKKILDDYKRIEIALRGFMPRLEGIRRELPSRYEDYVRGLLKFLRAARTRAVEPLFSDTVIPKQ